MKEEKDQSRLISRSLYQQGLFLGLSTLGEKNNILCLCLHINRYRYESDAAQVALVNSRTGLEQEKIFLYITIGPALWSVVVKTPWSGTRYCSSDYWTCSQQM